MQVFLKVKRRVATGSKTSFYTKSQKSSISIPRRATQLYCRLSLGQSQAHRKSRRFVAGLWAIQLFLNRVLTCWTFAWMHRPILSFIQVFAWILPRDAMQARPISLCGVHLSVSLSRSYCVETNHHSGFAIPNLMAPCRRGTPNGASNASKNGNSSPSGSGRSPAAKRILVQFKAQISNLWVLPNPRRRK